ncbi:T9SS type A sorting domain-containing protein [candidate division KSB1 bacterium]|nr:T9SS type A sorting domain-containing protein [candidate division KSB1 bacterium]
MKFLKYMGCVFIVLSYVMCTSNLSYARSETFVHAVYSHDGKRIILSRDDYTGVYVYDTVSEELVQVSDGYSEAYCASWDRRGERVGFKCLREFHGQIYQAPAVYDISRSSLIFLSDFSPTAGVPSFSENDMIAYTIGSMAYVATLDGRIVHEIAMPHYVNLARISPDGRYVVYNDIDDQLHLYNLDTRTDLTLSDGNEGYYAPEWSPDGRKILAMTLSSTIVVFDPDHGTMYEIGVGDCPEWFDHGQKIVFAEESRNERLELISSHICIANYDGSGKQILLSGVGLHRYPNYSRERNKLVCYEQNTGQLSRYETLVAHDGTISLKHGERFRFPDVRVSTHSSTEGTVNEVENFDIELTLDAPYIHQVYDTPDWFYAGHSACGAASAMMGIAYYHLLPPWTCTCSSPYRHESDYGRYISDIYSYNGYTYNVRGYNSRGQSGYGAFGFIVQNDWANTREYMALYLRQHGMGSSVDRSPTLSKIDAELESSHPFVILTSITDAGHYKLVVGHDINSHSIVVNDPYGNKNQGTYPNYNGKRVVYDWPGYNNGHENMNIVWCYIYMRYNIPDFALSEFSLPDTADIGDVIDVTTTIYNLGSLNADSASIHYYLSTNATFDENDILLDRVSFPELSAKDSMVVTTAVQIPDSIVSKKYGLGIIVDANHEIDELSEGNNLMYETLIIRGYPEIYRYQPTEDSEIKAEDVIISANFRDAIVSTDTSSLHLSIDGTEVTSQSEITSGSISYSPQEEMKPGVHEVQFSVANYGGYVARVRWAFYVTGTADIVSLGSQEPSGFLLSQNYPNPFNSSCNIAYSLERMSSVNLSIYSMDGKLVKTLVNERMSPGSHLVSWNGTDNRGISVSSGVYIYRMTTPDGSLMKRLLFLK